MKNTIAITLSVSLLIASITACGTKIGKEATGSDNIPIEDIDWSVKDGIIDGTRTVLFEYTNNSKYTIVDVEMNFSLKEDVTAEQLSIFDEEKRKVQFG